MKKYLFLLTAVFSALFLTSCGQSEQEIQFEKMFHREWRDKNPWLGRGVSVGVYELEIESESEIIDTCSVPKKDAPTKEYYVKFTILEEYPNRRVHYACKGKVYENEKTGKRTCKIYDEKETYSRFIN